MQTPERVFRVMAIDDDEDDQILFQRWVKRTDRAPVVRLVSSATAAMAFLKKLPANSPELPHVIFCDIKMPGVDGFDFLRWIRSSEHKQIPVVMRSASPLRTDIARAYQLGANSYVVKRMEPGAMEERINALVHYWRDVAEVPGR
ncbi:MAG TPA: response regulator [Candidatus Acidoferrum sp.]|nr:response regulator [Candidatus Acidoferrum sp.]